MDSRKIGYFIADCRKEKQITQQQLADKLNITNKAVSKWETGNGFPDISVLPDLADILGVTVDEILRAKKSENDQDLLDHKYNDKTISNDSDNVMSYLVNKSIAKFRLMSSFSMILSAFGILLQFFIWMETRNLTGWFFGSWLGICGAGIFIYYRALMKNQILAYNKSAINKIYVSDISNPYLKSLVYIWGVMLFTLIFYIFNV